MIFGAKGGSFPTGAGILPATILLPAPEIDLFKWAVIACDQYTAEEDYWKKVENLVGQAPSTFHLILPEVYLGRPDRRDRIARIHATMREYLTRGILRPAGHGFIYLERRTIYGRLRRGILAAVDLEDYDYRSGACPLIRATEATVLDRLPPRVEIRRGAVLEVPHVMVLLDDREHRVIETLAALAQGKRPLYETQLMMNGGEVRGFMLATSAALAALQAELSRLAAMARERGSFFLAVGDGNHSLAAAKLVWEELKAAGAPAGHPARYTLVEVVNLYDEGLAMEPIHRLVQGIDPEAFWQEFSAYLVSRGSKVEIFSAAEWGEIISRSVQLAEGYPAAHHLVFLHAAGGGVITVHSPPHLLAVGTLQMFLDELESRSRIRVDYIHGREALCSLARQPGNLGFLLPAMAREDLFPTVAKYGVLPKKSFSLGEAEEKRFYLECRQIAPV